MATTLRKWWILLAWLGLAMGSRAQTGSVNGVILDGVTGRPLADAEVIIQKLNKGTVSDRNGLFSLKSIPVGSYDVEFRHIGYVTQVVNFPVRQQVTLRVKIEMQQKVTELSPVEIRESLIRNVPYIRSEVLRLDILESPARDIGDQLRQTPNVSGVRKGGIALDPVVRGFRFGQLNVQVDHGMKIEGGCPNRMDPTLSHIETEEVEKMEVIKGPFALRYGPVMGGVINISTVSPKPRDTWGIGIQGIKSYESNWNGNREFLAIDGGDDRIFFRASGSRKEYGNYDDGNGNTIPTAFTRYSYRLQAGAEPVEGHRLLLAWENSKGRNVDYPALPMDELSDDTELTSLDYSIDGLSDVINSVKMKLYHSDVLHVMDNKKRPFSDTTATVSAVHALNRGGRVEAGLFLGRGHLITGVDFEYITKDGDRTKNLIGQPTLPVFIEQLWNEAWIRNMGLFGEYRLRQGRNELVGALRLDLNDANSEDIVIKKMNNTIYTSTENASSYVNVSISAGITHHFNDRTSASLALGRGVRSPDMLERFIILLPVGFDRFDYLGNPALKPEANHQADLTFTYMHPDLGQTEFNAFYAYITDYITGQRIPPAQQTPLTQGVLGVKRFYNADYATLAGFEWIYSSPAHWPVRLNLMAAYTHGTLGESVKYVMQGAQISGEEVLSGDAMPEIPPFEATASLQWPLNGGNLVPKASVRMVAAQKHLSASYGEDETPGFFISDLSVNYRFNELLRFTAGVKNLFDVAYYEHLSRRMILSSGDLYEPGRLFFVNMTVDINR